MFAGGKAKTSGGGGGRDASHRRRIAVSRHVTDSRSVQFIYQAVLRWRPEMVLTGASMSEYLIISFKRTVCHVLTKQNCSDSVTAITLHLVNKQWSLGVVTQVRKVLKNVHCLICFSTITHSPNTWCRYMT